LAVAAAVQAVALLLSAGGVDRAGAGQGGEGRFACHSLRVAARDEQLCAADGSDAGFGAQIGCELGDQGGEATLNLCHLLGEAFDATPEPAQHAGGGVRACPLASGRAGESLA
jgi:hypothetical protein